MISIVLSDTRGCKLESNIIARDQLLYLFKKAHVKNVSEALDPSDRQNVPAVLKLLDLFKKCIDFFECSPEKVSDELLSSIKILFKIFEGIISVFGNVDISLNNQLLKLSTLSHMLFYLYKTNGTKFIPGQLYHDLQRMIQGSFFACALQQVNGGGPLYLYQLGTDQLESLFAAVRTVTHSRNCDALELCHQLQHAHTINKILSAHPNWKQSHGKRLSGLKDASSQIEWIGCVETNTCDLPKLWLLGMREATGILELDEYFFETQQNGVTMIKPNKRCVGVTVDDERSEDLLSNDDSEEGDVHFHEGEIGLQLTEDSNASLEEIVAEAQEPLCR